MTGFHTIPVLQAGDGCRIHGVCEPPETRTERIAAARAEVAAALRVPIGDVAVVTTRHSPTHELIRGQWLPEWRR